MTLPSKSEVLERESRWLRPAGVIALFGTLVFAAGIVMQQVGLERTDNDAERLTQFHEHGDQVLAGQILQGLGIGMFAVPLYVLFKAAEARAERVRGALVGFCLIGPILFAAATILFSLAIRDAADSFVEQVPAVEEEARAMPEEGKSADESVEDAREELAEDVVDDSGLARTAASLQIPAVLAFLIALVYTCLWAMRTGLLTRFWGSLGMALGIGLILLGSFGLLLTVIWFAVLGLRFAGVSPKGLPPAWGEGVAIPWEPPGGQAVAQPGDPESVEGSGRELSESRLPEDAREGDLPDEESQQPGETRGPPRKKRKRRG